MSDLTPRERELVALGAAMGSNCVPCVEYHIMESRKIGLTEQEIHAAIQHADKIRQIPARNTLQSALAEIAKSETSNTEQPRDRMMGIMSKMMDCCGNHGQSAGALHAAENPPADKAAPSEGCRCG